MCEYFVKVDPKQYEQKSKTVRINGVLTSIRLENMAWDILAEMAEAENCSTNALLSTFHEEILDHWGKVPNFASFLRVTCMRYLRRSAIEMEKKVQSLEMTDSALAVLPTRTALERFGISLAEPFPN